MSNFFVLLGVTGNAGEGLVPQRNRENEREWMNLKEAQKFTTTHKRATDTTLLKHKRIILQSPFRIDEIISTFRKKRLIHYDSNWFVKESWPPSSWLRCKNDVKGKFIHTDTFYRFFSIWREKHIKIASDWLIDWFMNSIWCILQSGTSDAIVAFYSTSHRISCPFFSRLTLLSLKEI